MHRLNGTSKLPQETFPCRNGEWRRLLISPRNVLRCRKNPRPAKPHTLRVYEAHVGMSSEAEEVATYTYFKGAHSCTKEG